MTREHIQTVLQRIISEVLTTVPTTDTPLNNTHDLQGELRIDSLLALQIIVSIEQEFNILIEDDTVAIEMLHSLEEATDYVVNALSSNTIPSPL